jgi:hypothetical protein
LKIVKSPTLYRSLATFALSLLAISAFTGCGSKFPVRAVSGTVVCDGQPVTQGSITFSPIGEEGALESGKSATAALAGDGTFKLSTFGKFDGAIVGKHRVEFAGSEGEDQDETESNDDGPAARPKTNPSQACGLAQELILEVKSSGENVFKIELTKQK